MRKVRTSKRKKYRKRIIALIILIGTLLLFRNRLTLAFDFFGSVSNAINFRLVKVKSVIYERTLNLKSKINDISYIDNYIEKNKEKDFELQKSKIQNIEIDNFRKENEKLRTMLGMKDSNNAEYIAADVVFVEKFDVQERIFLNKGSEEGIILNSPVLYNGYLIGKVTRVGKAYSEVMLLTNKKSKISVLLNDNDMQILRGNGNGTFSIFNYNENVEENMNFSIKTSGMSDMFPRGLNIGNFVIKELNTFKQMKELRFSPSYKVFDIQSVLVYKWTKNDSSTIQEIEDRLKIEEEFEKNKGTTQSN